MPLPINVNDLLNGRTVESSRIEFKSGWNPEPTLHTISAFANDVNNIGGGYVIIGVETNNGVPVTPIKGLEKNSIDKIQTEILNICRLIEPRYSPVISHETVGGADIIVIRAYGGNERPYSCPVNVRSKKNNERGYYVRRASATVRLKSDELRDLFAVSEREPFDDRINKSCTLNDISRPIITDYLYRVRSDLHTDSKTMSTEDLCSSLRISRGPKEDVRPVNVGLMFFSDYPDDYFRYAKIVVVDKPDPTGDGMTEKIFRGPLDRQLADAIAYIRNYVIAEKIFKHDDRPEASRFFNYPISAVEEILSNAVYHKGYDIPEPITVTFTPECMTVLSLPGPDWSISDEDMKEYKFISDRCRNRRIGDFLKELKFIEGHNTGIPKIIRSVKNNGSELPLFKTNAERTYMRVTLPIHPSFRSDVSIGSHNPAKVRRTPAEMRRGILEILSDGESISLSDLSKRMGYVAVSQSLRNHVGKLVSEMIVEHSNPEKPNSPGQMIRLRMK